MAEQRRAPSLQRPRGKSPAERSEEFDATQARLKAEAAERRAAAQDAAKKSPKS